MTSSAVSHEKVNADLRLTGPETDQTAEGKMPGSQSVKRLSPMRRLAEARELAREQLLTKIVSEVSKVVLSEGSLKALELHGTLGLHCHFQGKTIQHCAGTYEIPCEDVPIELHRDLTDRLNKEFKPSNLRLEFNKRKEERFLSYFHLSLSDCREVWTMQKYGAILETKTRLDSYYDHPTDSDATFAIKELHKAERRHKDFSTTDETKVNEAIQKIFEDPESKLFCLLDEIKTPMLQSRIFRIAFNRTDLDYDRKLTLQEKAYVVFIPRLRFDEIALFFQKVHQNHLGILPLCKFIERDAKGVKESDQATALRTETVELVAEYNLNDLAQIWAAKTYTSP